LYLILFRYFTESIHEFQEEYLKMLPTLLQIDMYQKYHYICLY